MRDILGFFLFWGALYLMHNLFGVPGVIITLVVIFAGVALWETAVEKYEEGRRRRESCQHGIKGGETELKCDICKSEFEEARIAAEKEQAENERLSKLAIEADKFRIKEIARLSIDRLTRLDHLYGLSPQEFEKAIAIMYKSLGYKVRLTPFTNDRGKDLIMTKGGKRYVVECKRYAKDKKIGRPALRKFFAAKSEEKADKGLFITTGSFAKTAEEYAQNNDIELIDGNELVYLMNKALPDSSEAEIYNALCRQCGKVVTFNLSDDDHHKVCSCGFRAEIDITLKDLSPFYSNTIECTECGKKMRVIDGKYGKFYGCTGYPFCRNTERY